MDFGRSDYNSEFAEVKCNIPEDEPVFLLRASDPFTPIVVYNYLSHLVEHQCDQSVIDSLNEHVAKILRWQREFGTKNADLVRMEKSKVDAKFRIEQIIESLEVDSTITSQVYSELDDLMTMLYGAKSFKLLMPKQFQQGSNGKTKLSGGYSTDEEVSECILVLGVDENKVWTILKNSL